jgi:hypothetical protein
MHRTSIALAVLAPALAMAQTAVPDPANPKAEVPPLRYESAIARPRPPEPKPGAWKQLIEEVGRLGGHAGHLKATESPPAKDSDSSPKPRSRP